MPLWYFNEFFFEFDKWHHELLFKFKMSYAVHEKIICLCWTQMLHIWCSVILNRWNFTVGRATQQDMQGIEPKCSFIWQISMEERAFTTCCLRTLVEMLTLKSYLFRLSCRWTHVVAAQPQLLSLRPRRGGRRQKLLHSRCKRHVQRIWWLLFYNLQTITHWNI